nr:MAG TPA: hypothetical protein [Caudoviricetes sp.]
MFVFLLDFLLVPCYDIPATKKTGECCNTLR